MEENLFQKELENLYDRTTIKYIKKHLGSIIVGNDTYSDDSEYPQKLRFKDPFNFESLETEWRSIWGSFGKTWNKERQLFRYLWGECRGFFQSYRLYRNSFEEFVPLGFDEDLNTKNKMNILALNCEVAVRSIYEYGKQSIDIVQKINPKILTDDQIIFCRKFSETRNKFLTHYHNPQSYPNFIFDPNYWSVMGTGSLFEIWIHVQDKKERVFEACINFRHDYFKLEEIFVKTIRGLSKSKQ